MLLVDAGDGVYEQAEALGDGLHVLHRIAEQLHVVQLRISRIRRHVSAIVSHQPSKINRQVSGPAEQRVDYQSSVATRAIAALQGVTYGESVRECSRRV